MALPLLHPAPETLLPILWGMWKRGLREYQPEGNWPSLHIVENGGHEEQRLTPNPAWLEENQVWDSELTDLVPPNQYHNRADLLACDGIICACSQSCHTGFHCRHGWLAVSLVEVSRSG